MKIIYIFRKNNYAAILAAYLHLKMDIPQSLCKVSLKEMKLHYMGLDQELNKVYLLKYKMKKSILMNILKGIDNILNEDIMIVELERFDGYFNHIFYKYRLKNCRKDIEEYLHENNL